MATTIDQAFIKQFECCAPLQSTTCKCRGCLRKANKELFTVTHIRLFTVFASCVAVVDSAGIVRSNFPVGIKMTRAITALLK